MIYENSIYILIRWVPKRVKTGKEVSFTTGYEYWW